MREADLRATARIIRVPAALAVVAVVAAVSCAATVGAASTQRRHPVAAAPITWLAAGDSYSSGQGLSDTTGPCERGTAYPIQAYGDLRQTMPELKSPVVTACGGAVTADFFNAGDSEHRPEWRPAGTRYDLVTFTLGGNTLDFSGVITQCVLGPLDRVHASAPGHKCPEDSWVRQQIAQKLGAPFVKFLRRVADDAVVPGGNVVVLGYPDLLADPATWPLADRSVGSCEGITDADADQLRSEAVDLNSTIARDVAAVNAEQTDGVHLSFLAVNTGGQVGPIVIPRDDPDLFEPSTSGSHDLCGTGAAWLNGVDLLSLTRSFHPSLAGYVGEGHLLAQVLPHLEWPSPTVGS